MVIRIIIWVLVGGGIFFALPSTVYTVMFLGVFHRGKRFLIESDNLKNTQYYPLAEKLKEDILQVKALPYKGVELTASDGVGLFGRYYENTSDRAVILVHGYQSNAFNNFSGILKDFLKKGYSVLLIDQRAHGQSGGRFTRVGHYEKDDLLLWIDYIAGQKQIKDIVIYGISMGAATVGYASEHIKSEKVKALVMEAGFNTFYEMLSDNFDKVIMKKYALSYIYLTAKRFLKIDIKKRVEESLKNNKVPTLFLHGDTDKEVKLDYTMRSFTACASKKQMITVEGAGHTLCYHIGGETVQQKIHSFLDGCIEN